MKKLKRKIEASFVTIALLGAATSFAQTTTLQPINPYQFLVNSSVNSIGVPVGQWQQIGASVTPNGAAGTLGAACQNGGGGAYTCPSSGPEPRINLAWDYSTVNPNHFVNSVAATNPDNGWFLGFYNPTASPNTEVVAAPDIINATPLSHATNVSISGSGLNPTFNWTLPTSEPVEAVAIWIWDLSTPTSGVQANLAYSRTFAAGTSSFEVTDQLRSQNGTLFTLDPTHNYSMEIRLLDLRDPTAIFNGGIDGRNVNAFSVSRSFFDFTVLDQDLANVYLPHSTGGPAPLFSFEPIDVTAGQQIFIDPLLAIGYDYAIGNAADPKFKSVVLPTGIGDGLYDIYIWNGSEYVIFVSGAQGGQSYDFNLDPDADVEGVDRFRVLGIELAAGLDPADATAFITGLTFTADGVFRGTMQAITVSVPEPSTLALLALGALGVLRRKRRTS